MMLIIMFSTLNAIIVIGRALPPSWKKEITFRLAISQRYFVPAVINTLGLFSIVQVLVKLNED